jgi:integrase
MSQAHSRAGKFSNVGENLYRYTSNGIYYAVFRDKGKLKWKSLKTTDRTLAKRRLPIEKEKARKIDPKAAKMTLARLLEVYQENLKTLDTKTIATRTSIVNRFKETWVSGLEIQVRDVTVNHLKAWLGLHRERLRKSSMNEYIRFLRHIFEAAIHERVIAESPATDLVEQRRETTIRETPSWEQFEAIVHEIRSQRLSDTAERSADVVEFWARSGAGTAEAANLLGEHIDFAKHEMRFYRNKTDTGYLVPIFPAVRPLLEKLQARGQIKRGEPVFKIRDPKKSLAAACRRLGYPAFSARAFRRLFCTRAVEHGVDFKTISAWQGHKDGGVLIAKTYSHLRDAHSWDMAQLVVAPVPLEDSNYDI